MVRSNPTTAVTLRMEMTCVGLLQRQRVSRTSLSRFQLLPERTLHITHYELRVITLAFRGFRKVLTRLARHDKNNESVNCTAVAGFGIRENHAPQQSVSFLLLICQCSAASAIAARPARVAQAKALAG
eukprot:4802132-Amphidinium_carterae.1